MKVRLSYHHGNHSPGDEITVSATEGERLVRAKRGVEVKAKPKATKAPAKKAATPAGL